MSSRRPLIAVVLVACALLAGLAWFVTRHGASPNVPDIDLPGPAEGSSVRASDDLPREGSSERGASDTRRAAGDARGTPRLPPFKGTDGLRFVVLDEKTRERLPGTLVHAFECPSTEYGLTLDYEDWIGPDVEDYVARHGREYVADENGEVELPPARRLRFVTARAGERFEFRRLAAQERGLQELLLAPTHTLTALVLDANLASRRGAVVGLSRCGENDTFWTSVTGADGTCRIPNVEVILEEKGGFDLHDAFSVSLDVPCVPRVEAWIEPSAMPSAPIRLVLPKTGRVRVEIVDESARVVPVSGRVVCWTYPQSEDGTPNFGSDNAAARADLVAGVARLEDVGLGLSLEIEADVHGTGDVTLTALGPKSEGEEVVVRIPFAEDHTLLAGRIVDESGKPLASSVFDWRRILDDGRTIQASGRDRLRTDAEGRFTWTLRRAAADTGESTHRTGWLCEESESFARRQATISFPLSISRAYTDLGDVVAAVRGPLVSGRVIDAADRGLRDVWVTPRFRAGGEWVDADTFDGDRTSADGSFALYGPCLDLDMVVTFAGDGVPGDKVEPVPCRSGPVTLLVRGTSVGELEGTALVDPKPYHDLSIVYVRDVAPAASAANAAADETSEFGAEWQRAGERIHFRFSGLPVGRGRVEFQSPEGALPPVHVVENVTIEAGAVARPASLVDVDLRGKIQSGLEEPSNDAAWIEFTVVDVTGRPVPRGVAWTWVEKDAWEGERYFAGGRARVPPHVQRLELWAPGLRSKVFVAPLTAQRVVLEPMYEVEVRFEMPRELVRKGVRLVAGTWAIVREPGDISVEAALGTARWGLGGMSTSAAVERIEGTALDSAGRATILLPAPGEYGIHVTLSAADFPIGAVEDYDLPIEPTSFVVRDVDGRQVLKLRMSSDATRAVLEDLGLAK